MFQRDNFYIFSGGVGVGKTTAMDVLRDRGYICVDDGPRRIIQAQNLIGGDAVHDGGDRTKFRELMVSRGIYDYERIEERRMPVFFDRGLPELAGYAPPVPESVHNAVRLYRYNPMVFLFAPWRDIYVTDTERKHSWAEAMESYQTVRRAYVDAGYHLVEVPKGTPEERADFVLAQIYRAFRPMVQQPMAAMASA